MIQTHKILFSLFLLVLFLASPLKDHPSPYLSMHANDPVSWQIWGKDALQKTKAEDKLIYESIGYFSCHWCHVMQRESYSDIELRTINYMQHILSDDSVCFNASLSAVDTNNIEGGAYYWTI